MRTALRVMARIACWTLIALAVFMAIVCVLLIVHPDKPDARLGGVVMLVVSGAVIAGSVWGLKRIPRSVHPVAPAKDGFSGAPELVTPVKDDSSDALRDAERRIRAGEPVVLRPSKRRTLLLLLLSLGFTVVCVLGLIAQPNVWLALGALLFGPGSVVFALRLVPGRMYLRIDSDGLLIRGLKTKRWRWNDISVFMPYEITQAYGPSTKLVGFTRRDVDPRRESGWKRFNRNVSGVDVGLPDTYGFRHTDLADLLNLAHERYATEFGPSPGEAAMEAEAARVRQDRLPVVTSALAVACIALFVAEVVHYGPFPDGRELYDAGGVARAGLSAGRWWTLLTANVLHANPIHLVLNLFALGILGWLLERELGWARFGLLCLVGGVAAAGASVLVDGDAVMVGVSGVIFAITGWAVVRDRYASRPLGRVAWSTLPFGLVYTFAMPHVSIGAHLGGLVAGLAVGYAFERLPARGGERLALG